MQPKVAILILNYKRPDDTLECIESVRHLTYSNYEIIVIDNDSGDQTIERCRNQYPELTYLQNTENLGYAGGNNSGIRLALQHNADYVFILNNDASIAPDALTKLVETAEQSDKATIVAPVIFYHDHPTLINSAGTKMNWIKLRPYVGICGKTDDGFATLPGERELLPGAALLLKRKLIETVGLLGEDFFLIHEDADLCYRNRKAGFQNILEPKAHVYHKISRTLSSYPFLSEYYTTRNFLYLAKKHASILGCALTALGVILFAIKNVLLFVTQPAQKEKVRGFFIGIRDFFKNRTGRYQGAA